MSNSWSATVLTLFPEMFPGPLGVSLLGKALANALWRWRCATSATMAWASIAPWTTPRRAAARAW